MAKTKNNNAADREPILDPLAEGIVTDEFEDEKEENKEGE